MFSPLSFGLASLVAYDFPWQMSHIPGNLNFLCISSFTPTTLHIGISKAPCSQSDLAAVCLICSNQDSESILLFVFFWNRHRRFHNSTTLNFLRVYKIIIMMPKSAAHLNSSGGLCAWVAEFWETFFPLRPLVNRKPSIFLSVSQNPFKRVKTVTLWTCDRWNPTNS